MEENLCEHLENLHEIKKAAVRECAECAKTGDDWLHLRTCQTCGITLCCDSSPNQHASRHARDAGHPVATSAERGESWAWCYVDKMFLEF